MGTQEINKIMLSHFSNGVEYLLKYSYIENGITKDSEVTIYAKGKNSHKAIDRVFNKCFKSKGFKVISVSYC